MITLTIPNDDTIALRQFGKALIEIASEKDGHPVDVTVTPLVISTETLQQAAPQMMDESEVDTTAQQVESLSVPMGDDESPEEFLQRYNESEPVHDEEQAPPTTDSTGTPWDERIHSTSKALNADGTWRLRRKPKDMDEAEWKDYVNETLWEIKPAATSAGKDIDELISEINNAEPHDEDLGDSEFVVDPYDTYEEGELPPVVAVEPPVTPPGDDFHTDADMVTEQTVAGIPPLPVPPPVVVAPPVPEVTTWDFPRLMTFLTERHGKIDVATVNTLLAQDGMSSVQELNAHPDKIGPFVARVKAHLGE